ncbi:MAG TPA: hypothetical protein VGM37_11345 [Armatimonadota bacterium]|jgi:hypothetical protein
MNAPRFAIIAGLALAASSVAFAASKSCGFAAPTVSRVEAKPFQLKQSRTVQVGGFQQNFYAGDTVLTVTPANAAAYTLTVKVELITVSVINSAGDGYTDGVVSMRDVTSKQLIAGPLAAVNQNFGELTGLMDGRMCTAGGPPVRLRAAFHGVFAPDASGAYTLVNVDTHGVLVQTPTAPGRK